MRGDDSGERLPSCERRGSGPRKFRIRVKRELPKCRRQAAPASRSVVGWRIAGREGLVGRFVDVVPLLRRVAHRFRSGRADRGRHAAVLAGFLVGVGGGLPQSRLLVSLRHGPDLSSEK